jgi:molecular chaperone GrpE
VSRSDDENDGQGTERVVIRDRRKIDVKGKDTKVAKQAEEESAGGAHRAAEEPEEGVVVDTPALGAELEALRTELEERTRDLQRVTAEYANYRKRVDRDRIAVVEMATAGLLSELLPLLDDVERARQHGDLDGAFKSVGEGIEAVATKLGLERYGEAGEPFDPAIHEALMAAEPNPDSDVATCAQVLQPGYRLVSGRVLRPARVSVAEPGKTTETPAE